MKKNKFFKLLSQLTGSLNQREKFQAGFLCAAMAIGAGLEAIGLALIMPFIQLINRRELIHTHPKISYFYKTLGISSDQDFIILIGFLLLGVYSLKNLYFIGLFYFQTRFFENKRIILARGLMRFYLESPYLFHLQRNPSELTRNISMIAKVIDNVWMPVMLFIVEFFVMTVILSFLFVIEPRATLCAILLIGGSTLVFYQAVRLKISGWAKELFYHWQYVLKWMNQSFSGIKEIKIQGKEEFFLNSYMHHYCEVARVTRNTHTLNQLPRPFIETLTVAGVVGFVAIMLTTHGFSYDMTTTLALFGVAAFRLMPSMNRLVIAAMTLRDGATIMDLMQEIMQELKTKHMAPPKSAPMIMKNKIELRKLDFQYPNTSAVTINNISLTIKRNQSIAFVGHSGAGKTTIINLILGLLSPTRGGIFIDDVDLADNVRGWQRQIGYIPQQIFLSDDSILRNVAFGYDDHEINEARVLTVLQIAQLNDVVRLLPKGVHTHVGERGVRLSAGQQQRIGIARALYHDPEVLVLDEATSALDNETERALSQAIERLKGEKTMIIIAHRLSTVARCDRLFFMREGQIIGSGTYDELVQNNQDFMKLANG